MLSLTDRMAAALRRVIDDVSDLSNETLSVCHDVLADYDAERMALAPQFQPGQFVRSKHEPDNPMWQGEVIKVLSEGLVFFKTSDCLASAMHYSLELVPNLPATNTGD